MLDTKYQPSDIEKRVADAWEKADAFKAGRPDRADAETYCIVIPPPNVTGSLHMGHALNNTLQDVLCRFERMRGKDVLWQPGTDHAGIATQLVVTRQLAERQIRLTDIGREKFLEKVWEWKAQSGGTIINQLKRLGASCDWSRERFTMDEGLSKAVLKVFVELHKQGLIYRDKRLVNWDPEFQSAVSDLEVEPREHTGSFKWSRDAKDKDGNPVAFNAAALNKVLDRDPAGHMYYIRYPLKDDPTQFVMVGTTRPETMLGDTGVAIHPENPRLKHLIGKTCVLPLVGREIPIVGDEYADPDKGTGAVKITPAHDFNDWDVGKRCGLRVINILDAKARLWFQGNTEFLRDLPASSDLTETLMIGGTDRFAARKLIVERLAAKGNLEKIEPNAHSVPHGQRGDAILEPWLTDQWYANAGELAKRAVAAVREGKTRFVPEKYAADYFRWLDNIQPWCISRQLWWGHRIPAWYGRKRGPEWSEASKSWLSIERDPEIFVAATEEEAKLQARSKYGCSIKVLKTPPSDDLDQVFQQIIDDEIDGKPSWEPIWRDPDVLDTWFSSALWPFSTLGWPEQTNELARFYPTSCLVTGFDIIFFWVARMMMMGMQFMDRVPFKDVYIHGLVRDEQGEKMSKTKGNVMDPLDIIDGITLADLVAKRTAGLKPEDAKRVERVTKQNYPEGIKPYGTDALRFTLAALTTQGRDVKLDISRVEGYRNFATKLWNATRFAEMNECRRVAGFDPKSAQHTVNHWIAGETERAAAAITTAIEAYKFNEAATAAYEFVWGTVCDWYLELTKPIITGGDEAAKAETRAMTAWVLDQAFALLHPFTPFITEELWARTGETGPKRETMLALSPWPTLSGLADPYADAEIGWLIRLISEVRSVRSEMNVKPSVKLPLILSGASDETKARAERHADTILRLGGGERIAFEAAPPKGSAQLVVDEATVALPLAGVIDMAVEKKRLEKALSGVDSDLAKMEAKLSNPNFISRADPEAIAETHERKAELLGQRAKLEAAVKRVADAA